jgi:putative flippase GtrA
VTNLNKLLKLIKRYRELILYVILGAATTLVDFSVYYPLYFALPDTPLYTVVANTVAWICAVVFSFFANKFIVFSDKDKTPKIVIVQFVSFAGARLLSLGLETLFLLGGNALLDTMPQHISAGLVRYLPKLISQVFVVIANYIISKFFIFRKRK